MWGDDLQQPGTNAGDSIEPSDAAERPVLLPIGDNNLGQAGTHPRESAQLTGTREINVYPLTRLERARLTRGAVPLSRRRAGAKGGQKLDLARRLTWAADEVANSLTNNRQCQKQEQRAKLGSGHEPRVRR